MLRFDTLPTTHGEGVLIMGTRFFWVLSDRKTVREITREKASMKEDLEQELIELEGVFHELRGQVRVIRMSITDLMLSLNELSEKVEKVEAMLKE